ncbi:MAG: hypothetical protein MK081_13165 [Flavobacteriales bacterium]|nr:hypothetical protein [Flavobacteriales bacterium]
MKIPAYIFLLLSACTIFFACKRDEATVWDIHALAPLATGQITWTDLVEDSLLEQDENGLLHIQYETDLFDLRLDTLVRLDDTTIFESFTPGFNGGPINIPAGVEVFSSEDDLKLEVSSAEIYEVAIVSGLLTYTLESYVGGPLDITYDLPGVTLGNGTTLFLEASTESASGDVPWVFTGTEDLTNANLDLQGASGSSSNRIAALLDVVVSPLATEAVPVFGTDSVRITLNFQDVVIGYARGYFGNRELDSNTEIDFSPFLESFGTLNLQELSIDVDIKNTIGADATFRLDRIEGVNNGSGVELTHSIIGDNINLTRALDNGNGQVTSNDYAFLIDETNSNITTLVGSIPQVLEVDAFVEMNPLGDISGGNDFIYTDQPFEANLLMDLPLCLGTNGLTFKDSLNVAAFDTDLVADAELTFRITNSFPLGLVSMDARFFSDLGEEFDVISDLSMETGTFLELGNVIANTSESVQTISRADLDIMRQGGYIELTLQMISSGEIVKMSGDEFIDVDILMNGNIELSYE